jgi:DNA-binding transcriptional ArsR family regulator
MPNIGLKAISLRVLAFLADHAFPDGTGAYLSVHHVAGLFGTSPRNVQRGLKELQERGLILLTGRGRGTAYYAVDMELYPQARLPEEESKTDLATTAVVTWDKRPLKEKSSQSNHKNVDSSVDNHVDDCPKRRGSHHFVESGYCVFCESKNPALQWGDPSDRQALRIPPADELRALKAARRRCYGSMRPFCSRSQPFYLAEVRTSHDVMNPSLHGGLSSQKVRAGVVHGDLIARAVRASIALRRIRILSSDDGPPALSPATSFPGFEAVRDHARVGRLAYTMERLP